MFRTIADTYGSIYFIPIIRGSPRSQRGGSPSREGGGSPSGGSPRDHFATAGGGAGRSAVAEKLDDVVGSVDTQKN